MRLLKKDSLQIITFQSYGTDSHLYIRGRALEDEEIDLEEASWFSLLINSYKRLESDEIKHATLKVKLPDGTFIKTKTDAHGYFKIEAKLKNLSTYANEAGWLSVILSYDETKIKRTIVNQNAFPAQILIPSNKAQFGVISDIDDTILHTGVVSTLKWQLFYNTFFKSAKKRQAIEGAATFYHLLQKGVSGENANPIFYVSHSPWNLYRYLELFLKQNHFPKGPILLRSFKTIFKRKTRGEQSQKQKEIINLLNTYRDLSFILIGDSGEHDTDIYMEIAKAYPKRIKAIYVRSVKHEKKMLRVKHLIANYKITPILLVEETQQAINHARNHGFLK